MRLPEGRNEQDGWLVVIATSPRYIRSVIKPREAPMKPINLLSFCLLLVLLATLPWLTVGAEVKEDSAAKSQPPTVSQLREKLAAGVFKLSDADVLKLVG